MPELTRLQFPHVTQGPGKKQKAGSSWEIEDDGQGYG